MRRWLLLLTCFSWALTFGDTVCNAGCDHTTIQSCVDAVTAGEFCEVQANTPGGSRDYVEKVLIDGASGTAGNYITLRAREGDCVRIVTTSPGSNGHIVQFDNVRYWTLNGFCGIGTGGYSYHGGTPDENMLDQYGGIKIFNNSHHIIISNNGTHDRTDDYAIFGGWFYAGNLVGLNNGGSTGADGVHHILFFNNSFQLSGSNNCLTCAGGDRSTGDLLRIEAPQVVLEDNSLYAGGHNTIEFGEKWVVARRNLFDNDWRPYNTGEDGYRAVAFTPGDMGNIAKDSTGDGVFEFNVVRNALSGTQPGALAKMQAYRGVFRFNTLQKSTNSIGLRVDLNNGDDGDVSESKFYHQTLVDASTFWRAVENDTGLSNVHKEYSYVNGIIQDLGQGDPIVANVYIYNIDSSGHVGYPDGWKGREYRAITLDKAFNTFNIRFDDDDQSPQTITLNAAISLYSNVFTNWDEETVTFADKTLALTSSDRLTAFNALAATGATSLTDIESLTTMVGSGSSATSGTLADGRYFALADTDWDLGDWVENDFIWIGDTRVQLLTLNKNTGAATFTPAATWSDGEDVWPDYDNGKPTVRGAVQPAAVELTGPGRPMSPHL